jgi:hypothetical protein
LFRSAVHGAYALILEINRHSSGSICLLSEAFPDRRVEIVHESALEDIQRIAEGSLVLVGDAGAVIVTVVVVIDLL